jgi:hypothetical protein
MVAVQPKKYMDCQLSGIFWSFILGEISSPDDINRAIETLKWVNVQIFKNHAVVHISFSKTSEEYNYSF